MERLVGEREERLGADNEWLHGPLTAAYEGGRTRRSGEAPGNVAEPTQLQTWYSVTVGEEGKNKKEGGAVPNPATNNTNLSSCQYVAGGASRGSDNQTGTC